MKDTLPAMLPVSSASGELGLGDQGRGWEFSAGCSSRIHGMISTGSGKATVYLQCEMG